MKTVTALIYVIGDAYLYNVGQRKINTTKYFHMARMFNPKDEVEIKLVEKRMIKQNLNFTRMIVSEKRVYNANKLVFPSVPPMARGPYKKKAKVTIVEE